jgi:5-oxoprolinase (ATP-hydrolysing)
MWQLKHWGVDGLREGDVLVSNHPQLAGGSHLPDITVITPVFNKGTSFFNGCDGADFNRD